jgi:dTDP-4-amino-4,6-dideoxygalactose transaminase/acetyltransferase-like isoleucine patch superfamily enzyme
MRAIRADGTDHEGTAGVAAAVESGETAPAGLPASTAARAHPTAIVEDGAAVGEGTTIWHHSHVRSGAVIGRSGNLGKNVYIDAGVRIGDRVKIQNNVSVYYGVEIHDEVFVGPSAVFTNDLRPRAHAEDWQVTPTLVRTGASIGANATVVCGVEIGEHAMVAAGAVVTRTVRPHQLVAGNPARHRGWVCRCGAVISREEAPPSSLTCPDCQQSSEPGTAATARDMIPVSKVIVGEDEERGVLEVLRSGMLAQGEKVAALEDSFAAAHQVAHAVAVSNGTVALTAALRALGIGPGDEVITTSFSFNATLNAILEVGATARFADVRDDFTIDPDAVAALINDRTAAIMPVHLYGLPADMTAIARLARRHGLAIIEDAAQSHGATCAGRSVGSFGVGTFSLYGTKNITCGEGGIVVTDDDQVAGRLRLLRNQGMRARYDYEMPGYNWRLTDLQAAVALPQVHRLKEITATRSANAARLTAGLTGTPGLAIPFIPADRTHVWHQYTLRILAGSPVGRDDFGARLGRAGVGHGIYYPKLMHDYACYAGNARVIIDETPNARAMTAQVVSIPVHPGLSDSDLTRIVAACREAVSD